MKNNKLPQYWAVQQCNDPRFQKVLDLLNTYEQKWEGSYISYWYGYDGNDRFNGTNYSLNVHGFQNNPVPLTLDQFIELTEKFVLPDRWAVFLSPLETAKLVILKKWFLDNGYSKYTGYKGGYFYHNSEEKNGPANDTRHEGYTLISFDQFVENVVPEKPFVLPEHWCIQWKTKNIFDKTCKHLKKGFAFVSNGWITSAGDFHNTKPSVSPEITFQQFIEFVVKELIPIPEKWCIQWKTVEIFEAVNKYCDNEWIKELNCWSDNEKRYHNKKPEGFTEINFEQFLALVVAKEPIAAISDFNSLDWNIECKDVAQTQEVLQWIKDQNHLLINKDFWKTTHLKFMRYQKDDWAGNDSRNDNYPIEKSITWAQFQSLKTKKMKEVIETPSTDQTISRKDLAEIHAIACSAWKTILFERAQNISVFETSITFSAKQVTEMFEAATPFQLPVVSKFFTKPVIDKNAFKGNPGDYDAMTTFSKQLFGDSYTLQLLDGLAEGELAHLKKKALYIPSEFEVTTGKADGGTWISIFKK